jgi:uncharacterized membrane protein YbhN (UPF0104 family)
MVGQKVRARGWKRFRALFSLRALIALGLGAIVLATLLSLSGSGQVWHLIAGFPLLSIAVLFALVVGRELLRSIQWRLFLNAIGIHASRREAFLTLAGGDAAQVLPGGLYFQDLLISRELQTGVSAPLAATALMIWMEITLAMLVLAALGLPGIPALRPVMAFCAIGSLVVMVLLHTRLLDGVRLLLCRLEKALASKSASGGWVAIRPTSLSRAPQATGGASRAGAVSTRRERLALSAGLRKLIAGMDTFIGSFAGLSHPKVLVSGLALCTAYTTLTILGFYLVCAGLGISSIGPAQAAAIYSLVLGVVDANPLPSDLGLSELSGVGGFLAFHVDAAAGLAAMLTFRVLLLLSEELVAGAAFVLFREETRRLFRRKGAPAEHWADRPRGGAPGGDSAWRHGSPCGVPDAPASTQPPATRRQYAGASSCGVLDAPASTQSATTRDRLQCIA